MGTTYNQNRHLGTERLSPPFWHSRYVHLKLLRRNIERVIADYLGKENQILADFGCGNLPYAELIKPKVSQYIGIDLKGNPNATVFIDEETNKTTLPDDSCDVVWSVQVLEHVSNPKLYLNECIRLLKPGGKLILCTHGHWMYHPDPIDYWRWTSEGLRVEIARTGFEIENSFGMMGLLPMSLQLLQDACLISFPLVKLWKYPFQIFMQFWIGVAEKFTSFSKSLSDYTNKDACVYFVIATKPL